MKQILSILTLLIIGYAANAGHSENTRGRCRSYAKKYAANGHIFTSKCGVKYNYGHDKGCNWAEVHFTRTWCCDAAAETYSRADGSGQHGFYHAACRMSGSTPSSELGLAISSDEEIDTTSISYTPGQQDASNLPEFQTNSITLSEISVVLASDINDPSVNTYTLAVWQPYDDTTNGVEDTVYSPEKAISAGTVSLQNGNLVVTGDIFSDDDFSVSQEGDIITVTYIGSGKTVSIPDGINVEDLGVISFGDIKEDENSLFKKISGTNNGVISGDLIINTYPNPAINFVNISVKTSKSTSLNVLVYDAQGKLIKEMLNNSVSTGSSTIKLNVEGLPIGEYFILIEGNGIKVMKQILKK